MLVTLDGKEYIIQFSYEKTDTIYTYAVIKEPGQKDFLYSGYARCSKKDNFSRPIGRVLALKCLLSILTNNHFALTKEQKKYIWKEYFKMTNNMPKLISVIDSIPHERTEQ